MLTAEPRALTIELEGLELSRIMGVSHCIWVEVQKLIKVHFLHWLEALSLVGRLSEGLSAMADLTKLLKVKYYDLPSQTTCAD